MKGTDAVTVSIAARDDFASDFRRVFKALLSTCTQHDGGSIAYVSKALRTAVIFVCKLLFRVCDTHSYFRALKLTGFGAFKQEIIENER